MELGGKRKAPTGLAGLLIGNVGQGEFREGEFEKIDCEDDGEGQSGDRANEFVMEEVNSG